MKVKIESYDSISLLTVDYITSFIEKFVPSREKPFYVLALSTGRTLVKLYKYLVEYHNKKLISFDHVAIFVFDEFVGLPSSHESSYHSYMYEHLFAQIDIDPANVIMLDGMAPDLSQECIRFDKLIEHYGGIDLCITGVGADARLAFNDPGSSLDSTTREKILSDYTRKSLSNLFRNPSEVPKKALTAGLATIMNCRTIFVLVTGSEKAEALRHIIEKGVTHMWPASILQEHPDAIILCDDDSTSQLTIRTVNYFKSLDELYQSIFEECSEIDMLIDKTPYDRMSVSLDYGREDHRYSTKKSQFTPIHFE